MTVSGTETWAFRAARAARPVAERLFHSVGQREVSQKSVPLLLPDEIAQRSFWPREIVLPEQEALRATDIIESMGSTSLVGKAGCATTKVASVMAARHRAPPVSRASLSTRPRNSAANQSRLSLTLGRFSAPAQAKNSLSASRSRPSRHAHRPTGGRSRRATTRSNRALVESGIELWAPRSSRGGAVAST